MGIEVVGPLHNRVDAQLIVDANNAWNAFLAELQAGNEEYGVNNNSLKATMAQVKYTMDALYANVSTLPAQGRRIAFKAESTISMSEILRAGG